MFDAPVSEQAETEYVFQIADWCQSTILFIDSNEIEKRAQMIVIFRKIAEVCSG